MTYQKIFAECLKKIVWGKYFSIFVGKNEKRNILPNYQLRKLWVLGKRMYEIENILKMIYNTCILGL